jgi:hypothetical protein
VISLRQFGVEPNTKTALPAVSLNDVQARRKDEVLTNNFWHVGVPWGAAEPVDFGFVAV